MDLGDKNGDLGDKPGDFGDKNGNFGSSIPNAELYLRFSARPYGKAAIALAALR